MCDLHIIQNIYGSFNPQNTKSSSSDCHVSLWRLQERPRLTLSFDLTGETHPHLRVPVNGSSCRFWVGCMTPRVSGSLSTNILNQLNPWSVLRQAIRSKSLVGRTSWEAALLYQRWVLSTGEQPFMPCCLNNIKQVFKAADMSSSGI